MIYRYLCISFSKGSKAWLIKKELEYGGKVIGVKRNKVSDLDPRSPQEFRTGGMTGFLMRLLKEKILLLSRSREVTQKVEFLFEMDKSLATRGFLFIKDTPTLVGIYM